MNAPRSASTVCKGYLSVAATEDLSWMRMESNAKVRCMVVKEASGPLSYIVFLSTIVAIRMFKK